MNQFLDRIPCVYNNHVNRRKIVKKIEDVSCINPELGLVNTGTYENSEDDAIKNFNAL